MATLPPELEALYLVNSGSEANELALRLARTFTQRNDVLVLEAAYHGNTQTLIDLSPYKHGRAGGRGAPPWVHVVPLPDRYRRPERSTGEWVDDLVAKLHEAETHSGRAAAFFAESISGCGGQVFSPRATSALSSWQTANLSALMPRAWLRPIVAPKRAACSSAPTALGKTS
ncbi:MAG: aminotransferase class III-fold pyridoxal phosphate-dependent enzyme [Planctomycetota bacterium]